MKKLATLFLAGVLSLGILAVGASADFDGAIKKGTAKIDGIVDEAYKYSFAIKNYGTTEDAYGNGFSDDMTADLYFMYDDSYLYICADVKDGDVLTKGEAFATGANPYANDNVEFRLYMVDDASKYVKVGIDAYGYQCYGLEAHYDIIDYSTIKYATTYTDTSYVVEAAVPCTKGQLDMIKFGKLGIKVQLNDIDADGKHYDFAASHEGEGAKDPVYVVLSSEAAKVPATAGTTTTTTGGAAAGTTTGTTTAPSTFDPAIIAVALTAASGAAFVFASKKR